MNEFCLVCRVKNARAGSSRVLVAKKATAVTAARYFLANLSSCTCQES